MPAAASIANVLAVSLFFNIKWYSASTTTYERFPCNVTRFSSNEASLNDTTIRSDVPLATGEGNSESQEEEVMI